MHYLSYWTILSTPYLLIMCTVTLIADLIADDAFSHYLYCLDFDLPTYLSKQVPLHE
jgi:hypothetical protein